MIAMKFICLVIVYSLTYYLHIKPTRFVIHSYKIYKLMSIFRYLKSTQFLILHDVI